MSRQRIGIVGGLGPLAGADIFFKLVRSTPAARDREHLDIIFEQHPFEETTAIPDADYHPHARNFYVYNTIRELEKREEGAILLTCFISHSFQQEIQPEITPSPARVGRARRRARSASWGEWDPRPPVSNCPAAPGTRKFPTRKSGMA